MPNYAVVQVDTATDIGASVGILTGIEAVNPANAGPHSVLGTYAKGSVFEFGQVLRVEQAIGITPSKAFVSIRNVASFDEEGAIVLNDGSVISEKTLQYFSRACVDVRGTTVFIGSLYVRDDDIESKSVTLEYWDDRWLLSKIPMRGCLVYDKKAQAVKWLTRYVPIVNPGGYRNCTSAVIGGVSTFVFTELGEQGTEGQTPYDLVGQEPSMEPGVALFWTPARFASYLRAFATIARTEYAGTQALLNTGKLLWPEFGFTANSPSEPLRNDFATHRMTETSFQGQYVLGALVKTLEDICAEYTLGVGFKNAQSELQLVSCTALNKLTVTLPIQTSGPVSDIKSMFRGVMKTNASEWCGGQLVEGSPPLVEGRFEFIPKNGAGAVVGSVREMTTDDIADVALYPEWTADEETKFMRIITMGVSPDGSRLKYSDGTEIPTHSVDLMQIARNSYPKPWRCFSLRGAALGAILNGVARSIPQTGTSFGGMPRITSFKALRAMQLQPYFETNVAGKVARGRIRLDMRIETQNAAANGGGVYHDVLFNNGLRIDDDGLIWFDGLTDDIGETLDRIYTGDLRNPSLTDPDDTRDVNYPKLKKIRLNATIACDFRVYASASIVDYDPHNVKDRIAPDVVVGCGEVAANAAATGRLLSYVHNPEGFREEHQVASYPCEPAAFQVTNDDGTGLQNLVTPVNKILHSDATELAAYAKRKLKDKARLIRSFRFDMIGVRPEFMAGQFVEKVQKQPSGEEYPVNGVADRVIYYFESPQRTSVIGNRGGE